MLQYTNILLSAVADTGRRGGGGGGQLSFAPRQNQKLNIQGEGVVA